MRAFFHQRVLKVRARWLKTHNLFWEALFYWKHLLLWDLRFEDSGFFAIRLADEASDMEGQLKQHICTSENRNTALQSVQHLQAFQQRCKTNQFLQRSFFGAYFGNMFVWKKLSSSTFLGLYTNFQIVDLLSPEKDWENNIFGRPIHVFEWDAGKKDR